MYIEDLFKGVTWVYISNQPYMSRILSTDQLSVVYFLVHQAFVNLATGNGRKTRTSHICSLPCPVFAYYNTMSHVYFKGSIKKKATCVVTTHGEWFSFKLDDNFSYTEKKWFQINENLFRHPYKHRICLTGIIFFCVSTQTKVEKNKNCSIQIFVWFEPFLFSVYP